MDTLYLEKSDITLPPVYEAAPALLEALRALLDASERHIFSTECQRERDAARAAIAKAEGKR